MDWIRNGSSDLTPAEIEACDDSLRRLQTDVIDLYQIHWPNRNAPVFGALYFDPGKDREYTSIHDQFEALARLVKAGKVRHIGLSNETPWGVCEFVRVAEAARPAARGERAEPVCAGEPRGSTTGSTKRCTAPACRCWRIRRSASARSPASTTTPGFDADRPELGPPGALRLDAHAALGPRPRRWRRRAATTRWRASTASRRRAWRSPSATPTGAWPARIIGVTTRAQLDECLDAWGTTLSADVLARDRRDPLGDARPCAIDCLGWPRKTNTSARRRPRIWLRAHGIAFTEHPYDYVEHGGTAESARQLGVDEHAVVKTLVMQDEKAEPLIVLMHGDRQVSTKNLARADRREERRAVQARGGAAPQRLPGRRHVAVRHAQGDAACSSRPACSSCRASTSTAAGAATWWASRRRC